MIWEEDGPHYNRLVLAERGERAGDRLNRRRDEPLFDIVIPVGFNDATAELGRGSAIFVHAARADMGPTSGCIGVPREALLDLVRRLEPGMAIDIGHGDDGEEPRDDGPLEAVRFCGLGPGPRLIVLGAVHGNEPCGPDAILRAIGECRAGGLAIRRGEVTFVPVANLKAYRLRSREGDRNLNRDLREKTLPQDFEDRIGNRICALLREHDILLDIHSFKSEGEPFVFAGPPDNCGPVEPFRYAIAESDLAARLGPPLVIRGWLDVYARFLDERRRRGFPDRAVSEGVGTTEYMRFSGGYGVTIECGQHEDPASAEVAYRAIVNALAHLGLISAPAPPVVTTRTIQMTEAFVCEAEGDRLTRPWRTADAVGASDMIAVRANGEPVLAPSAGFLVFPNHAARPGDQLCYFGVSRETAF
jgi:predicted deacylase